MTQEEKLKEAKKLYETANADQRYVLESLFPELKESGDERIWIINYLSNRILNSTIIAEKENLKKAIAWLEKQGEQKHAWSEEDEKMLKWLCRIVHSQRVEKVITLKEESELGKWMDKWLNHNPQPHWKPSDEQMKALAYAVFDTQSHSYHDRLSSLEQQLKKLRYE